MIIVCVEVLASTTVATILHYVNVSGHMYILNLIQCYMPNILQLKNLHILLSILCAFCSSYLFAFFFPFFLPSFRLLFIISLSSLPRRLKLDVMRYEKYIIYIWYKNMKDMKIYHIFIMYQIPNISWYFHPPTEKSKTHRTLCILDSLSIVDSIPSRFFLCFKTH